MIEYKRLLSRCRTVGAAAQNLGICQTAFYYFQRARNFAAPAGRPFVVFSKRARHPLSCRAGTSDVEVFGQMFVQREYRCIDDIEDAGLIIDCGGNAGFSAAYFLSRFPNCSVICVEPDPGNFKAMQENLRAYGTRVTALCSAIWSCKTGLVMSEEPFGDGREWARSVRAARPDELPTVEAIDIGTLIRECGRERVSILKIDIEGAEEKVFAGGSLEWLAKVDNLIIELHGRKCEELFLSAIAGERYEVSRCDDLTVCRRPS